MTLRVAGIVMILLMLAAAGMVTANVQTYHEPANRRTTDHSTDRCDGMIRLVAFVWSISKRT